MLRQVTGLSAVTAILCGCANFTHLTRTRNLDQSGFILIDAKQRAISSYQNVNCAEPSPDALSALAASQAANLSTPQGMTAGHSLAIAEAAGSIGLRTQSIQLLRDFMFRVCESYQAGKISPFMVELLHRRFQTTMVSVLAIEQLTGAVRAPAIVLGGSSTSGNADAVLKLTASRETQLASIDVAEKEFASKTTAAEDAAKDVAAKEAAFAAAENDEAKAAAKTALDQSRAKAKTANDEAAAADLTLSGRRAALAAIDRAMTLAQSSGSASATGTIEGVSWHPRDIDAVANAVVKIVQGTYELGNTGDFCTALLANAAQQGSRINDKSEVTKACLKFLASGQMILDF